GMTRSPADPELNTAGVSTISVGAEEAPPDPSVVVTPQPATANVSRTREQCPHHTTPGDTGHWCCDVMGPRPFPLPASSRLTAHRAGWREQPRIVDAHRAGKVPQHAGIYTCGRGPLAVASHEPLVFDLALGDDAELAPALDDEAEPLVEPPGPLVLD